MSELISVITPAYNCEKFIERTIKSVQNQTYANWEMVIVDDCSTDDTGKIVEQYAASDNRIRYVLLETNSGPAAARTRAMELAKGEYIAFLDSDDVWKPEKLEKQLAYMKAASIRFCCTSYEHIDENDNKLNRTFKPPKQTDYNRLLLDCPVGNSTVMYDVTALGKFAVPNIRKRNDDALWLQMLKKEKYIYGMPEVLAEYRVRENSVSSNKLSLIRYHWQLYREIEHLSVFRSAFHVAFWCFLKVFRIK